MASIFASSSGARVDSAVIRSPNASSADAIGAELVAQLRDLGVRLVEVLHLLAEHVEVLRGSAQRVHLPRRLLRQIVDLAQPLVQRLERELLLRQVVGLRKQRVELLGEAVDLLVELDQVLVFRRERVHPRFGLADRASAATAAARRTPRIPSS